MFGITVTVNNYIPARQVSLMEDTIISLWRMNRAFTCYLDQSTFEVFDAITVYADRPKHMRDKFESFSFFLGRQRAYCLRFHPAECIDDGPVSYSLLYVGLIRGKIIMTKCLHLMYVCQFK